MDDEQQRPWWRQLPPIRRIAAIAGAVLLLAGFVWVWWQGIPALYWSTPGVGPADQLKATTDTRTALLAGLAALGALGTFWLNSRAQRFTAQTLRVSEETFRVTEQAQLNDRYVKAVELIGSDSLTIRLAGIYALERMLAEFRGGPELAPLVEILSAFVRERSYSIRERAGSVDVDIAAIVTVLGRAPRRSGLSRGDLTRAYLPMLSLSSADLSGAVLNEVDLRRTRLDRANLSTASLGSAELSEAYLSGANLSKAWLNGARLENANLMVADLRGAFASPRTCPERTCPERTCPERTCPRPGSMGQACSAPS
jgi:hypothetical protein